MKRYTYVHILAALFLILGMGVHTYVSYSRARIQLQEKMDLEMQIAQEKLLFELYDALEARSQLEEAVKRCQGEPERLFEETGEIINRFSNFYSSYVAFPPYYYPEKGKWFCLNSYRTGDSIVSYTHGDAAHDYFEREWYKGAARSTEGYWSTPYRDENFDEPIYTYSKALRDGEDNLICVIGIDFSLDWIHKMLEHFKPFKEAVFMLYSSNGTLLAASDGAPSEGFNDGAWIVSRKTLQPINIKMVTAVPKRHILRSLRWGILLPLSVFVLGIFVVGLLIRRLARDERRNARLETEKEVLSHELQIAHDIQMGILKDEKEKQKAQGKGDIELHTLLMPMREVGGDLFDFHREGDELWFIIGDVSGKGVPAAIFMSAAVNLFRAAGVRANSPREIMEEMNAVLSENNPSMTFITAFIGCLYIPTGELIYCNAGHCTPLIRRQESAVSIQMEPNIPLGFDGGYSYVEEGCMIGEGETLVLYTDGVTEARNSEREMLGLKRWADIVASHDDPRGAIEAFMGKAEPTAPTESPGGSNPARTESSSTWTSSRRERDRKRRTCSSWTARASASRPRPRSSGGRTIRGRRPAGMRTTPFPGSRSGAKRNSSSAWSGSRPERTAPSRSPTTFRERSAMSRACAWVCSVRTSSAASDCYQGDDNNEIRPKPDFVPVLRRRRCDGVRRRATAA